jgi:hypothetical protein
MNDFTKEELGIILYSVDAVAFHEDEDRNDLFNKIQSMIDNYCEHEWQMNNQLKCNKCGVKVG